MGKDVFHDPAAFFFIEVADAPALTVDAGRVVAHTGGDVFEEVILGHPAVESHPVKADPPLLRTTWHSFFVVVPSSAVPQGWIPSSG